MKTIKANELKNLRITEILEIEYKKEEYNIQEVEFLFDFAGKFNNSELFFTHSKALQELAKFINEKRDENN